MFFGHKAGGNASILLHNIIFRNYIVNILIFFIHVSANLGIGKVRVGP